MVSEVECGSFPSRSPSAVGKTLDSGLVKGRDTVVVSVNGGEFEVGRGVVDAQDTHDESTVLDNDFCLSDDYLARLRGALYYMMDRDETGAKYFEGDTIGLLMVGLPVATFRNEVLRKKLKTLVTGRHELPSGHSVNVERVLVMPQPMGAFFEYAFSCDLFDTLKEQINLIIDPGFFTFDWLMSRGLTPQDARSNSVKRGMSAVIRDIATFANEKESWNADIGRLCQQLDAHFSKGTPFTVFNKPIDVSNYIDAGKSVVNQAVASLVNSVGSGQDINNIILAGGGAPLYLEAIKKKFPHHNIVVTKSPVFSNVRGFQLAGEQQVLIQLRNAQKTSKAT
jgi:plasmid segregation protein ParM